MASAHALQTTQIKVLEESLETTLDTVGDANEMIAGWLDDFEVGSLVGWLVGWFVRSLVRWFVGSLVGWFVGYVVGWFVGWFVFQSVGGWSAGLWAHWAVG